MKLLARLRVLCKTDCGGGLVEIALVTPILMLLALGAVDYGRAYWVQIQLTNAAHAGAEYGSRNYTDTTGMTAAATAAFPASGTVPKVSALTVTSTYGCECSDGTSYSGSCSPTPVCVANATRDSSVVHRVKVTTSATYTTLFPWTVPLFAFTAPANISSSFNMSITAAMRAL